MVKVVLKSFFSLLIACCLAWTSLPSNYNYVWEPATALAATSTASPVVTLKGKVKFIDVEGGCYQLITTDNTHYELQGDFPQQDGVIVKIQGTVVKDSVSLCQVGQPLLVKTAKVLKNR
jgi:hypothetical protein